MLILRARVSQHWLNFSRMSDNSPQVHGTGLATALPDDGSVAASPVYRDRSWQLQQLCLFKILGHNFCSRAPKFFGSDRTPTKSREKISAKFLYWFSNAKTYTSLLVTTEDNRILYQTLIP